MAYTRRQWICTAAGLAAPVIGHSTVASARTPPLVVVVSANSSMKDIGIGRLRRVFLARPTEDTDGRRIVPFNQPPGSSTRVLFDQLALRMDEEEVGRYWIDQKIRGRAGAPRSVSSIALIRKVVAKLPGAMAYIRANHVDKSVRALRVNGKKFDEKGYPFRG